VSRHSDTNEEDAQLQRALALSREQHEVEEALRKGDEIKLQMAIEESKKQAVLEVRERVCVVFSVAALKRLSI